METEVLQFLKPEARSQAYRLRYPFRWKGRHYRDIVITRPNAALYGAWSDRDMRGRTDAMELYAAMCDLPVAVFRGLDADDGMALMDVAYTFVSGLQPANRRPSGFGLKFPFWWQGQVVTELSVTRPTAATYGEWSDRTARGQADAMELYAALCGMPAPVLRGMDAEDGMAVAEAAFDFLPLPQPRGCGFSGNQRTGGSTFAM